MQKRVAAVWREVLEAPSVSLDENFFDIGGTSILLIRIRKELQDQLARQIPITWMFECTTIRAIAARLSNAADPAADESSSPVLTPSLGQAQEQARRQRDAFARMRSSKGGRS
jgi:hypothetical protein